MDRCGAWLAMLLTCGCAGDDGASATFSSGDGGMTGAGGIGGEDPTGGAGGTGPTGTGGSGGATFSLDVSTELDGTGALILFTNVPHDLDACEAAGAPCFDDDVDGLNDAWEDVVIDRLRPFVRLDEAEQLVNEPGTAVGLVARVTLRGGYVVLYMMLGYARDYGSCGGFTAHNGDSERVVLELELLDETTGDAVVHQAYTAAHEGTINDHGMVFGTDELGELVHEDDPTFGEPRWVVFASANKHATYASAAICEAVSPLPCVDEDCSPDGVADPTPYTLLLPFTNAGEPTAPLLGDLSPLGFPGEDAWLDQPFCGGLGGSGCASSVYDKLTVDPF